MWSRDAGDWPASFGGRIPKAAFWSLSAHPWKGERFCLKAEYVRGFDRWSDEQVFVLAERPEKSVRFLSSCLMHGLDPSKAIVAFFVDPMNCQLEDLQNVLLVSDEVFTGA